MNMRGKAITSKAPYQFDTDHNGFPVFSQKNLRFILALIENDSNYRIDFDTTAKDSMAEYLYEHFPDSKEELRSAVKLIDKENSTHLSVKGGIDATVDEIMGIGLDKVKIWIQNGNVELVNMLAKAIPDRLNFSFATKFCTYCNRYCFGGDDYAIFDDVVAKIMPYYAYVYLGERHWKEIRGKNTRNESTIREEFAAKLDYAGYNELVGRIINAAKQQSDTDITRADFDRLLWYYYKGIPDRIKKANACLGKEECRILV